MLYVSDTAKDLPTPKVSDWERLATENEALVVWYVNRYYGTTPADEKEELFGEGFVALVRAARTYDPDYRTPKGKPVRFSTYAVNSIANAVHRYWAAKSAMSRGGGVIDTFRFCELVLKGNTEAGFDSQLADVSAQAVVEPFDPSGFDLPERKAVARRQIAALCRKAAVTEREERILVLYYIQRRSYQLIAEEYGITKERIRQLASRTMQRLKEVAAA